MKRHPAFWIVAALAGWPWSSMAQPDNYWHLETGPLTLDIYVTKTAHLFHVVDQISQWSEFCHRQYSRYFDTLDGGINAADRECLAEHAALRKTQGWGGGLAVFLLATPTADGLRQEFRRLAAGKKFSP